MLAGLFQFLIAGSSDLSQSGGEIKTIWRVFNVAAAEHVVSDRSARSKFVKQCVTVRWDSAWVHCSVTQLLRNGILSVIRIKRVHCVYDLGEIVFCLCAPGLVLDCFERREKQADQNRNDCDDDQ